MRLAGAPDPKQRLRVCGGVCGELWGSAAALKAWGPAGNPPSTGASLAPAEEGCWQRLPLYIFGFIFLTH